jgi:hypothetical protein
MLVLGILVASAAVAWAASSPTVTTGSVTAIKDTSAALGGTINPNGAATAYHFDWGLTSAYGATTASKTLAAGTKSVAVKETITPLLPGTVYHYRLDAQNSSGIVFGRDRTFRSGGNAPPGVTTGPVSSLGKSGATVTGVINPSGATTTWIVQYGLTTAYTAQTLPSNIAAGATPVTVAAVLTGLEPGTTFHYRLVAMHGSIATQYGADATFETYPSPAPKPRVRATTTPRRDRTKAFTFTTNGRITGPRSETSAQICTGSARVSYFMGRRRLSSHSVPIQPNCTFFDQTSFRKLPGHGPKGRTVKLRVVVSYGGSGWLAAASARNQTVTLG